MYFLPQEGAQLTASPLAQQQQAQLLGQAHLSPDLLEQRQAARHHDHHASGSTTIHHDLQPAQRHHLHHQLTPVLLQHTSSVASGVHLPAGVLAAGIVPAGAPGEQIILEHDIHDHLGGPQIVGGLVGHQMQSVYGMQAGAEDVGGVVGGLLGHTQQHPAHAATETSQHTIVPELVQHQQSGVVVAAANQGSPAVPTSHPGYYPPGIRPHASGTALQQQQQQIQIQTQRQTSQQLQLSPQNVLLENAAGNAGEQQQQSAKGGQQLTLQQQMEQEAALAAAWNVAAAAVRKGAAFANHYERQRMLRSGLKGGLHLDAYAGSRNAAAVGPLPKGSALAAYLNHENSYQPPGMLGPGGGSGAGIAGAGAAGGIPFAGTTMGKGGPGAAFQMLSGTGSAAGGGKFGPGMGPGAGAPGAGKNLPAWMHQNAAYAAAAYGAAAMAGLPTPFGPPGGNTANVPQYPFAGGPSVHHHHFGMMNHGGCKGSGLHGHHNPGGHLISEDGVVDRLLQKQIPCVYHNAGYCWFGHRCHFSHDLAYAEFLRQHWLNPDDIVLKRQVQEKIGVRYYKFASSRFQFMPKEGCKYNMLVLDLHGSRDEIVEFPCILISKRGKEVSRFHRWVSNKNRANAVDFPTLLEDLEKWLQQFGFSLHAERATGVCTVAARAQAGPACSPTKTSNTDSAVSTEASIGTGDLKDRELLVTPTPEDSGVEVELEQPAPLGEDEEEEENTTTKLEGVLEVESYGKELLICTSGNYDLNYLLPVIAAKTLPVIAFAAEERALQVGVDAKKTLGEVEKTPTRDDGCEGAATASGPVNSTGEQQGEKREQKVPEVAAAGTNATSGSNSTTTTTCPTVTSARRGKKASTDLLPSLFSQWCNVTEVFNDLHNLKVAGVRGCLNHLKLLDLSGTHPKHGFPSYYGQHDVENLCKVVQDCFQLSPGGLYITSRAGGDIIYDKDPCYNGSGNHGANPAAMNAYVNGGGALGDGSFGGSSNPRTAHTGKDGNHGTGSTTATPPAGEKNSAGEDVRAAQTNEEDKESGAASSESGASSGGRVGGKDGSSSGGSGGKNAGKKGSWGNHNGGYNYGYGTSAWGASSGWDKTYGKSGKKADWYGGGGKGGYFGSWYGGGKAVVGKAW
eukprot:CAMPEP_0178998754 /NCGR_PEP_ID=MMETSP0795-20121207/9679_1 /TAXON_ID=88552 /ORGANISM="Amoebophrya sp., Strain Ameob2" /LENGTH=1127 /DNA_ID=CAMNT_0020691449 /DNA_START=98 /DNA_END=3481 /DNA_ORIENTATION=-